MDKVENWADLSWEEKREERFKQWLSPEDVKFVSPEAEKLYKERVTRFIKAIKMEEPDRVPVMLPVGSYLAYYAGADFRTIMYDYNVMRDAWVKFMDDFGDMDTFSGPGLIPSGKISEVIDSKIRKYPGIGLPMDASMNQFVEGEYMNADEYDLLLLDPSDYYVRVTLPRTTGLLESFSKLPPLRSLRGAAWVNILTDPDIRKTFQTLMDLAEEYRKWQATVDEIGEGISLFRGDILPYAVVAPWPEPPLTTLVIRFGVPRVLLWTCTASRKSCIRLWNTC
ncbi:hypothetical protein ACFLUL_00145 [Chloroflexota bacterium]